MTGTNDQSADPRIEVEKAYELAGKLLRQRKFKNIQGLLAGFNDSVAELAEVQKIGDPPSTPLYSIVLVSHAHSPDVVEMLESVAADSSHSAPREVVIVDNGNQKLFSVAEKIFPDFTFVRAPLLLGASGGRNLGAKVCSGRYVVFIDDDGSVCIGCIGSLIQSLEETGAVAVRGRVIPKSSGMKAPGHYDLGSLRIPALTSCEGVSAWSREDFLRFDGFDVALFGHEGLELCARMFPFYGPLGFIYEPKAILRHNPSVGEKAADKEKRYSINKDYVDFKSPETFGIVGKFDAYRNHPTDLYLARTSVLPGEKSVPDAPISVLTTARNASLFLDDYTWSWKRVLPQNAELVYVDDNSDDGSFDAIKQLWDGDRRFIAISNPRRGRGAALNTALSCANNDICLIADVDDISTRDRIPSTIRAFENAPDLDYLSFLLFNEKDLFRAPRKSAPLNAEVGIEALFGMPAPFPAFAFRRSRFDLTFDECLSGGIDCDWFRRSLAVGGRRGLLIQRPVTYYRQHSGQITRNHNPVQKTVRKELIYQEFDRILGGLATADHRLIDILVDLREATAPEKSELLKFIIRTIDANGGTRIHDHDVLAQTLLDAFKSVRMVVPSKNIPPDDKLRFEQLCAVARRHIKLGEFKQARRTLREALQIRKDREVQRQLLVASKYLFIRALAGKLWRQRSAHIDGR